MEREQNIGMPMIMILIQDRSLGNLTQITSQATNTQGKIQIRNSIELMSRRVFFNLLAKI